MGAGHLGMGEDCVVSDTGQHQSCFRLDQARIGEIPKERYDSQSCDSPDSGVIQQAVREISEGST